MGRAIVVHCTRYKKKIRVKFSNKQKNVSIISFFKFSLINLLIANSLFVLMLMSQKNLTHLIRDHNRKDPSE